MCDTRRQRKGPSTSPLKKPNLKAGRGAVSFTRPPGPQPERSTARRTNIQRSADTSYILTPAQLALVAKSTASFSPTALPPGDKTLRPTPDCALPAPPLGWTAAQPLPPLDASNAWLPRGRELTLGDTQQGEPRSLMQPQPLADVHPFTPVMKMWRHGIKVDCGPNWSWDAIEAAVECGPHPTACTPEAWSLFKEDIAYQVTAGFSQVVLWDDIKHLQPRNLKISPVAIIPQEGRRSRIILDLSFLVYQEVDGVVTVTQKSVNDTTVLSAPSIPVRKIGKVLPRLLQYMRDTLAGLHILFCKLDISDGFWRLVVHEDNYW
jgi:hypothetical protein